MSHTIILILGLVLAANVSLACPTGMAFQFDLGWVAEAAVDYDGPLMMGWKFEVYDRFLVGGLSYRAGMRLRLEEDHPIYLFNAATGDVVEQAIVYAGRRQDSMQGRAELYRTAFHRFWLDPGEYILAAGQTTRVDPMSVIPLPPWDVSANTMYWAPMRFLESRIQMVDNPWIPVMPAGTDLAGLIWFDNWYGMELYNPEFHTGFFGPNLWLVPEPGTLGLFALGFAALVLRHRVRRSS